jgi:putative ABC transport system permease protein
MARHDLVYAVRVLSRRPAFALLAILTVALGVGATTAIFSVVHSIVISQLPYPEAERLVVVGVSGEQPGDLEGASLPDYLDWRESGLFDAVGAYDEEEVDVTGRDRPFRVAAAEVSRGYFDLFEARAVAGRLFTDAEFERGRNRVILLSRGLWDQRFGADVTAIGTTLRLGGEPHEIVGVVDAADVWPSRAELWMPLAFGDPPPQWMLDRDSTFLNVLARLRSDVAIAQAHAQLDVMARRVADQMPADFGGYDVEVLPLRAVVVGPQVRLALGVLFGAVLFVLLSACMNVVNLLLARAIEREREFAVRTAMGASRWALLKNSLIESAVLAVAGGGLGLLVGYWGVQVLVGLAPPDLPRLEEVTLNAPVVVLAVALVALTALVFGLVPAARIFSGRLTLAVRESSGNVGEGTGARRVRRGLVIAEVALSLVLLVGAGLLIRSFASLAGADPGIPVDNLLTVEVELPDSRYPEKSHANAFYDELRERLERLPGVRHAAAMSALPLGGGGIYMERAVIEEHGLPPPAGPDYSTGWVFVTPGYFQTLGIPLERGRAFEVTDDESAPPVVVINRALARQVFGERNPIGLGLRAWAEDDEPAEVIGIVGDVRQRGLDVPFEPVVYAPQRQVGWTPLRAFAVRTTEEPPGLIESVRAELYALDPELPVGRVRTADAIVSELVARDRFNAQLLAVFALVALALSAVGIYGTTSYYVAHRTREIGLRLALGANPRRVLGEVVWQGVALSVAGIVVGVAAAVALARTVASLLFGIGAADPATYVAVSVLLAGVAAAASFAPARRASRVDPLIALRAE